MEQHRDRFTITRIIYESVKEVPLEDQALIYNTVFEYCFNFNEEVELKGANKAIFNFIKVELDKSNKQFLNGKADKTKVKKKESTSLETLPEETIPKEEKFTKKDFKKTLIELGANESHIDDWFIVRTNKKASFTKTALKTFLNECTNNNFQVYEAVKYCAENSWSGFKVQWVENLNNKNGKQTDKSNEQVFKSAMESEVARGFKFK